MVAENVSFPTRANLKTHVFSYVLPPTTGRWSMAAGLVPVLAAWLCAGYLVSDADLGGTHLSRFLNGR